MAVETGTAANWVDALAKLRTFLTTNSALVAAGQAWQELRWLADNLETIDTNMTIDQSTNRGRIAYLTRPDFRTQNYNSLTGAEISATGFQAGQYIRMKLRTAKAVTSFTYKGGNGNSGDNPRNFRIEYSDDGTTWTTALTVTDQYSWVPQEERTYAIPGSTGAHLWWRFAVDLLVSGSILRMGSLLLFNGSEQVNSSESNLAVKGTGLAGADEIFLFFRTWYATDEGAYALLLNAGTGFLPNERSLNRQPGLNNFGNMVVPLWQAATPYWFVANGRRVMMVFKVSTSYESAYAGLFLPFATPAQYALPLYIGGSTAPNSDSYKYDFVHASHSGFAIPGMMSYPSSGDDFIQYSNGRVMLPDGTWFGLANRPNSSQNSEAFVYGYNSPGSIYPYNNFGDGVMTSSNMTPFRENIGGGYSPVPLQLFQRKPTGNSKWLGQLDGVVQISGFGNGAENTGVIDGVTYTVFQNCYRNSISEFFALKME